MQARARATAWMPVVVHAYIAQKVQIRCYEGRRAQRSYILWLLEAASFIVRYLGPLGQDMSHVVSYGHPS